MGPHNYHRVIETETTNKPGEFFSPLTSRLRNPARTQARANSARASQPARVLIVESNQDGTVGGSHQALFDLATRLDPARFEPIVLFNEDNVFVGRLRERGVQVVLFDDIVRAERQVNNTGSSLAKLKGFATAVLTRRRELRRLGIDLLHLNNSPAVGSDDWLPAARLVGIPCVVTAMGDSGQPRRRIHRWLFRQFDGYFAISRYISNVLREHGVDGDKIELVYLGVDFDNLRRRVVRSRSEVRNELGVAPYQLLAIMVGNIRPWKGQREVIAALRMLPQHVRRRLRFCFAGATAGADSRYEAELRAEISEGGLDDCVSILGPRSDVADLYAAADIAVHASTTPEPFGLVVPEAMALNCAVIAASSGGPAEVITPGTGFLCDPLRPAEYAHTLERLVQDDTLRRSIATAGQARATLFSVQRTVEGTERVYDRALRGRPKPESELGLSPLQS